MCIRIHIYRCIHVSIYNMKCLWDFIRVCQKHARTSFLIVDVGGCTCIYLYVYVHMYTYMYMYISYIHIYTYIYIYIEVYPWYTCEILFVCANYTCGHVRTSFLMIEMGVYVCVHTYIYIYIHVCIYIYTNIYIYIYTCVHIYTYTWRVVYCTPVRFRFCMPATREDIVPDGWCGCICVCICVYIYVYILIHIYLYVYINIHTNTCKYIYIDVYILYTCEISFLCAKSTRGRRSSWLNTRPVWSCCGVWHLFKN